MQEQVVSCEMLENADPSALDLSDEERVLMKRLQQAPGATFKSRIDNVFQQDIERFVRTALVLSRTRSDALEMARVSLERGNGVPSVALADDFE